MTRGAGPAGGARRREYGRAGPTTSKPAPPSSDAGRTASTTTTGIDPAPAARLQRIMVPLIRVMDHPMPLDQVKVGIGRTRRSAPQTPAGTSSS